uniref:Uncharacterized protein n=1 Tax=Amphimedon queenslandica TaxID=400682 RepID=A0A1X7VKK0_AMPQE
MSITVEQLQFHSNVAFPSMSSSAPAQAEIARTATVSTMQQQLLTTSFLPPLTTSATTLAAAANTSVAIPAPSLLPAASSYCCTNAWSHFRAKFFFCRGCASPLPAEPPRVFDSAFSFTGGRLRAGAAYTGSAGCWSCVVPRLSANTKQHLVFELGKAQQSIGVHPSPCKGHSFYIGTATAAAQAEENYDQHEVPSPPPPVDLAGDGGPPSPPGGPPPPPALPVAGGPSPPPPPAVARGGHHLQQYHQ